MLCISINSSFEFGWDGASLKLAYSLDARDTGEPTQFSFFVRMCEGRDNTGCHRKQEKQKYLIKYVFSSISPVYIFAGKQSWV
jgi:hypothetical protein